MRILLDECIPRRLKASFRDHVCLTVPEAGFGGKKNGVLLGLAETAGFDVFVTMDRGLEFQQHLSGRKFAVIVLFAASNRLADLLPLVPEIRLLLETMQAGTVLHVGGRGMANDPVNGKE